MQTRTLPARLLFRDGGGLYDLRRRLEVAMKARKISATAATTQVITGAGQIRGFSIREAAAAPAAATVRIYDAVAGSAIADLAVTLDLAANASKTVVYGQDKPLNFKLGVRVVVTGQVEGSIYVD